MEANDGTRATGLLTSCSIKALVTAWEEALFPADEADEEDEPARVDAREPLLLLAPAGQSTPETVVWLPVLVPLLLPAANPPADEVPATPPPVLLLPPVSLLLVVVPAPLSLTTMTDILSLAFRLSAASTSACANVVAGMS